MYPFIKALNGSARVIVGMFGLKPASEHEERSFRGRTSINYF